MLEIELTEDQITELRTALRIAREVGMVHATTLRHAANTGGNALVTPEAAIEIAEQREAESKSAGRLLRIFTHAYSVWVQKEEGYDD